MIKFLLFLALCGVGVWVVRRAMRPSAVLPRSVMARDEAAKLLGVDPAAPADAVIDAHRRLIAKVHPDTGGSAELAARINKARDTMLGR